jgi:hypothetical protein
MVYLLFSGSLNEDLLAVGTNVVTAGAMSAEADLWGNRGTCGTYVEIGGQGNDFNQLHWEKFDAIPINNEMSDLYWPRKL